MSTIQKHELSSLCIKIQNVKYRLNPDLCLPQLFKSLLFVNCNNHSSALKQNLIKNEIGECGDEPLTIADKGN